MEVARRIRRRLVEALITLLGASVLIWALLPLAPGSPARLVLMAQGVQEPTPAQIAGLEDRLGLDGPLPLQYLRWLSSALRGDFGLSFTTGRPVSTELAVRLPPSLILAAAALLLALVLTVVLAVLGAQFHRRWPDHVVRVITLVAASLPGFVIALILVQVVVLGFGWGKVALDGTWAQVWLPAVSLAVGLADGWSRLLRANLVDFFATDTAEVLTARGARRWRVLWRHGLPNSAVPSLHAIAIGVATLIGGAVVVETVFAWPGLGAYVVESVKHRDMPVIQAYTMLATLAYVLTSLVADLASGLIDRRIVVAG